MKKIIQLATSFSTTLAQQATLLEYQKADLITNVHILHQEKTRLTEQESALTQQVANLTHQIADLQTEINALQQEKAQFAPISPPNQISIEKTQDRQITNPNSQQKISHTQPASPHTAQNGKSIPNNTQDSQTTSPKKTVSFQISEISPYDTHEYQISGEQKIRGVPAGKKRFNAQGSEIMHQEKEVPLVVEAIRRLSEIEEPG